MSDRAELELRRILEALDKAPASYIPFFSVETAIAFVCGLASAGPENPLKGFQPWLVEKTGGGSNMIWWALARRAVRPDEPSLPARSPEGDARAQGVLDLVLDYLRETEEARDG